MRTNEKLTNKTYDDVLGESLPMEIRSLLERNRNDERRHLDYITRTLRIRSWEQQLHP